MASGEQQEGHGEEVQEGVPAASADGDSASLSGEPSILEPSASPAAVAEEQAAAEHEAAMEVDCNAGAEGSGAGFAAAAAAASPDAAGAEQEEDAEPVVHLASRAEEQTDAQLAAQPQVGAGKEERDMLGCLYLFFPCHSCCMLAWCTARHSPFSNPSIAQNCNVWCRNLQCCGQCQLMQRLLASTSPQLPL